MSTPDSNSSRNEPINRTETIIIWQDLDDMGEIISELTSSMWPPPYFRDSPRERDLPPPPTVNAPSDPPRLSMLTTHPYSSAFLLGATITASALAGGIAARYALRKPVGSNGHAVLAEFTGDCAARLARLEKLVQESHASQVALADQVHLLSSVQKGVGGIEKKLAEVDTWKVPQLHSRLTGVENNMVGQWRDMSKAFDSLKGMQRAMQEEMSEVRDLQGSLVDIAGRLDNFGKWSEVEVLNVLEGIKGGQAAGWVGLKKGVEEEMGKIDRQVTGMKTSLDQKLEVFSDEVKKQLDDGKSEFMQSSEETRTELLALNEELKRALETMSAQTRFELVDTNEKMNESLTEASAALKEELVKVNEATKDELVKINETTRGELVAVNEEMRDELLAAQKAAQAAVAELDSKNKHDWRVITETLGQVGNRLGVASGSVTPASGGDTSESIQLPFPLESGDKDGFSQCTVILMPEDEGSSHLLKLRYRSRWFTRDRRE